MVTKGRATDSRGHFFHVTHSKNDNKWHVKEVKGQNYETFDSKEKAIEQAEKHAKNVERWHVVVHRDDGKFETIVVNSKL